jgi:hypothetical protein
MFQLTAADARKRLLAASKAPDSTVAVVKSYIHMLSSSSGSPAPIPSIDVPISMRHFLVGPLLHIEQLLRETKQWQVVVTFLELRIKMALPETKGEEFSWQNLITGVSHLADNKAMQETNKAFPNLLHALRKEIKSNGFEVVFTEEPKQFSLSFDPLKDNTESSNDGKMIISFRP